MLVQVGCTGYLLAGRFTMSRCLLLLVCVGVGCHTPVSEREQGSHSYAVEQTAGGFQHSSQWASNFPAEADLAILLDTQDEPLIDFESRTEDGTPFLPAFWLNSVKKAYSGTFAEDAIEVENFD